MVSLLALELWCLLESVVAPSCLVVVVVVVGEEEEEGACRSII